MGDLPAMEVHARPGQRLGMPVAAFMRVYWQKRPLLIRGAFPDFKPPLDPDDLAGLACEDGALARLIERDRTRDAWTVHHGPLEESLFARLPDRDWTLLVQDVDKWDADVAALLAHFRFLPSWRLDDIMISYAEDGGGVGAHLDQYDVFLLQGLGKRCWSIDTMPDPPTAFRDDVELKQLREFNANHTWTLDAGDVLYLPPGVPHDGVADGKCMTISIGMRAPAVRELQLDLAEYLAERLPESLRYADPDLASATHAGEIDAQALDRIATALGPLAGAVDASELADWFGSFITRYRSAQVPAPPDRPVTAGELAQALANGAHLLRNPWTRLAWVRHADGGTLFAAGDAYRCSATLAERLCDDAVLRFDTPLAAAERDLLATLINQGHLVLAPLQEQPLAAMNPASRNHGSRPTAAPANKRTP